MQASQVKSAARVIEVLQYFQRVRQPRAMTEIAVALGYPQSSTTVLLKTMIALGYLNFDRKARVYFPTLKVTALGDWIPRSLFGTAKINEMMQDVHAATGETVGIAVKNDVYFQYIQLIQSAHALRFHVEEGALRLLTQSANGWLLLSTLPDDQVDALVRRANVATQKPSDRVKASEILERVRAIRKLGYCSAENVPFLGGATICVLLPLTIQNQPVVLGLGGILERVRLNHDKYLAIIQNAAKSLTPVDPFQKPIEIGL